MNMVTVPQVVCLLADNLRVPQSDSPKDHVTFDTFEDVLILR